MKVIIGGLRRGGTTAVTGIIRLCGIPLAGNSENNLYLEDMTVTPELDRGNIQKGKQRIKQIFTDIEGSIALKYNHFCKVYNQIKDILPSNFKVILTSRDYWTHTLSMVNRDKMQLNKALDWHKEQIDYVINFIKTFKGDLLIISFYDLFINPDKVIDDILNFCNLNITNKQKEVIKEYLKTKEYKPIKHYLNKL